ncbi:MAG: sugar transferase [Sphingopyxis sp.]|uniref:sugar transferase n=1 Tax=Sphingopyxis sp. TaxID=1908224 RepID=UPI002ABC44D2|nr:sugar transferase [Sphingopyxis sp.]MDZ3831667.1 sugar transferase [Sphingopyxis sp.]
MSMKRAFDFFASLAIALIFLPVLAVLAVLIRFSMGRPVLFRQTRPGLHGTPFEMLKFRSMRDATDRKGNLLADRERITPLGNILRATSLDELPELWNVLKGDMSLVGPRPLLMEYLPLYTAQQARRHEVRPGLTGWAQVNGRNALDWDTRFALDVWYVDNRNLVLDMRILFMTFLKVLKREGISAEGEATMSKFKGTGGGSQNGRD